MSERECDEMAVWPNDDPKPTPGDGSRDQVGIELPNWSRDQLAEWIGGLSQHHEGICVPDFSCCQSQYAAPRDARVKFAGLIECGSIAEIYAMAGEFMKQATEGTFPGLKVEVRGEDSAVEGMGFSDPLKNLPTRSGGR